ncbi:MAG: hypothetical protein ABJC62_08015 [Frankiaceae bacterium]
MKRGYPQQTSLDCRNDAVEYRNPETHLRRTFGMTLAPDDDGSARRPLRNLLRPRAALALGGVAALAVGGTAFALRPTDPPPQRPPTVAAFGLPGSPGNAAFGGLATTPPLPTAARTTPQAAVTAYLTARRQGNDRASYALLPSSVRARYGSLAQWSFGLRDSPRLRSFTLVSRVAATTGGVAVPVQLRQQPALDPIAGFVPARAAATYLAVRTSAGWQVQPDPIEDSALLPPDRGAAQAAQAWLTARTRCADPASRAVQVSDQLLGVAELAAAPCTVRSTWRIGAVERLEEGPAAQSFTAAYGSGVANWGRLVPIVSPHGRFFAALAPLGDQWRVFGLLADRNGG